LENAFTEVKAAIEEESFIGTFDRAFVEHTIKSIKAFGAFGDAVVDPWVLVRILQNIMTAHIEISHVYEQLVMKLPDDTVEDIALFIKSREKYVDKVGEVSGFLENINEKLSAHKWAFLFFNYNQKVFIVIMHR